MGCWEFIVEALFGALLDRIASRDDDPLVYERTKVILCALLTLLSGILASTCWESFPPGHSLAFITYLLSIFCVYFGAVTLVYWYRIR